MIELPKSLKTYPWTEIISQQVSIALKEDLPDQYPFGKSNHDITGLLISKNQQIIANLLVRDSAIISGKAWVTECFRQVDPSVTIKWSINDGDRVKANSVIAIIEGKARAILTAERTALNFLQTLSATATNTWKLVSLIKDTPCKLLDTRKTIPGMRMAQKYAVFCGGGKNHRIGLHDRFLIKENHILSCGSIEQAITAAKQLQLTQQLNAKIEIEVESIEELKQAINAEADIIMLDNFTPQQIREAMQLREHLNLQHIKLEASGNLNSETIVAYAATGIDYVSVGAITKSIEAIDLSLRVV